MNLRPITKLLATGLLASLMTGGVTAMAAPSPVNGLAGISGQPSQGQDDQDKRQEKYPDAERKSPETDLRKQETADKLNKGLQAVNAGNGDKARNILQPLASGDETDSKYAQAMALQGLANLKLRNNDMDGAISALKKALGLNSLPNNDYFDLKLRLAQFYAQGQENQKALDALHDWRQKGKRKTAESWGLEGVLDYRMQNYDDAISAIKKAESMTDNPKDNWEQVLTASYAEAGRTEEAIKRARKRLKKNPDDQQTRHNLVVMLMQGQKYDKALDIMETARSKGELSSADSYVNMAKLYLMKGQNSGEDPKPYADKAMDVLQEAADNGTVDKNYDYYNLRGQAALVGGDRSTAANAFKKAVSMGNDGEAALRLAQLQSQQNKPSDALASAKKALSRGTQHEGSAWMVIGESKRAQDDKQGAIKAMKKAAQDPETKSQAQDWLQDAGQ